LLKPCLRAQLRRRRITTELRLRVRSLEEKVLLRGKTFELFDESRAREIQFQIQQA
jgi:hypothetical protein